MALSFGRALLAGAAGVAQYSNEEQQRRQKRLDRVAELQDRLNLDVAKSKYAAKYNRYEDNKKTKKALGKTDPKSLPGQIILGQIQTGLGREQVLQLASQGSRWDLEDIKEPTLSMPQASPDSKAVSPIQDWFNGYRGTNKANEREQSYQQQIGSQFTPTSDEIPDEQPQAMQLPEGPVGGSIEPMGTTDASIEPEAEPLSAQLAQMGSPNDKQFADLIAKPKIKWEVTKQDGVQKGTKGKFISFTDPDTLNTKTLFVGNNQSGSELIDPVRQQREDGSEVLTDRFIDLETGDITLGDMYQTKPGSTPKDKSSPVELVSLSDYQTFTQPKTDSKPQGQFFSIFPKDERESWEKALGEGEGFLGLFDDTPDGFTEAISRSYLDAKNGIVEDELLVNSDLSNPKTMAGFQKLWKAQAYIQVLGEDGLVDAINNGLDKSLFYGELMNNFPEIEDLHKKIGLTNKSNPEEFNKLTNKHPRAF